MSNETIAARGRTGVALLCLVAALLAPLTTYAADDFYKGRRLNILINFPAGGPTDLEGRILARHIGKHLPGNGGVVVQNLDGAGGMTGLTWLGEVAPRDGGTLGLLTSAAFMSAVDPTPRRADFRTYEFVGYRSGTSVYFMRSDVKPGIRSPADIGRAEGVISGGLSVDSPKDVLLRLTLDMLGKKFLYVTAYKGSQGARLALQNGEINFFSESPPTYRGVILPGLVAKGEVTPIFYDPEYDGEKFSPSSQVEGLNLPTFPELYQQIRGGPPSGELFEAYKVVLTLHGVMQRIAVYPPQTPKAAVEAMRAALAKLNEDKEYIADNIKSFGFHAPWTATEDSGPRIRKALNIDPRIRTFINDYIRNPPRNRP